MKTTDDESLVRRCLDGNPDAHEELLDRYEKRVFNVALRMVHNPEDARDVTQTVFTKVFTHLVRFDPRFRLYGWIYRITVNESINLLNSRRPVDEIDDSWPSSGKTPGEALHASEISRAIQGALMELSPDYRAAVLLRHFAGCSHREMSQILGIPEKTVKSRLFSARRLMRKTLAKRGVCKR